jgi:hypothetical protein
MNPHSGIGGSCLLLLLALTAAGAAPESTVPNGSPAAPVTANVPAPVAAPGSATAVTPKTRPRLSPETANQVLSGVPAWNPQAVEPAGKAPPAEPDIVRMDPLIVWGERLPKTDKLDWLTPEARDVVLVKTYITPFDRFFLNRFTLPIFGISKEARARTMYEEDKRLREMRWMNDEIDQIKRLDAKEAKALLSVRNALFSRFSEY